MKVQSRRLFNVRLILILILKSFVTRGWSCKRTRRRSNTGPEQKYCLTREHALVTRTVCHCKHCFVFMYVLSFRVDICVYIAWSGSG